MKTGDMFRDALLGLTARPGRTVLAFSAMAAGALAFSLLLGVLGGLRMRISRLSDELGTRTLAILSPEGRGDRAHRPLTLRQMERLQAGLPEGRLSAVRFADAMGAAGIRLRAVMTDEHLANVRGWRVVEGRFLDPADVRDRARSLVATVALATLHEWRPGMDVRMDGLLYRVVGVVEVDEADLSASDAGGALTMGDRALFVPLAAHSGHGKGDALDIIFARAPPGMPVRELQARAEVLSNQPDFGAGPVRWVTAGTLTAGLRRFAAGVRVIAGSVVGLVMAFGGALLSVLWLLSVRERVPEIGLRRALGGSRADMGMLFLAEGAVLSLGAAVMGVVPAQLLLWITSARGGWRPGGASAWAPVIVTVLVGGLFSWIPARRAAGVEPAEALRSA